MRTVSRTKTSGIYRCAGSADAEEASDKRIIPPAIIHRPPQRYVPPLEPPLPFSHFPGRSHDSIKACRLHVRLHLDEIICSEVDNLFRLSRPYRVMRVRQDLLSLQLVNVIRLPSQVHGRVLTGTSTAIPCTATIPIRATGLGSQPEVPAGTARPWSAAEDLVLAATVVSVTSSGRSVSATWQAASDALAAGLAAMSAAAAIAAFAQVSRFLPPVIY